MEKENIKDMDDRLQLLENENNALKDQCEQLKKSEHDTTIKYQNCHTRMSEMSKCSFNMLENCRNLRRTISDIATNITGHKQQMSAEYQQIIPLSL